MALIWSVDYDAFGEQYLLVVSRDLRKRWTGVHDPVRTKGSINNTKVTNFHNDFKERKRTWPEDAHL